MNLAKASSSKRKYFLYSIWVLIFILAAALALVSGFSENKISYSAIKNSLFSPAPSDPIHDVKLLFTGDIMMSRAIGRLIVKNNDWHYPFLKIADYTNDADITFGNLEGPISSGGIRSGSIYSFEDDPRSVEGLLYAGYDVVSIANNHMWDYGEQAFDDTLNILEQNNIAHIGGGLSFEDAHKPFIKEVNGTRIAYLAYTNLLPKFLGTKTAKPAVAFPDKGQINIDITNAKKLADIVVVSFHWGDEYETRHNAFQEDLAHFCIDSGADLIIGHHPHVAQEIEKYKSGYVAYSLGNFVFDQNFSTDTAKGLTVQVYIKDKKITEIKPLEVNFNSTFQPYLSR